MFFTDGPGNAVRGQAARARDSAHGDWHELRGAVAPGEDGPCPRTRMAGTSSTTGDGGMLDVERTESRLLIYEVLPSRYGINIQHLRQADAIEITIGQGAKPGTGGLLLGSKVSDEVAALRDLPRGSTSGRPAGIPISLGPTT